VQILQTRARKHVIMWLRGRGWARPTKTRLLANAGDDSETALNDGSDTRTRSDRSRDELSMRILVNGRWTPGYPRYARLPGQVRLRVCAWMRLAPVQDAFFTQHGLRKLLNYLRAYGYLDTWRRIRSRLSEAGRNEKFVAFGVGIVMETDGDPSAVASTVAFVAPIHPACVEEITLAQELVRPITRAAASPFPENSVLSGEMKATNCAVEAIMGWRDESGSAVPDKAVDSIVAECLSRLADAHQMRDVQAFPLTKVGDEPADATDARRFGLPSRRPRAVLFGLGHYARFALIPRVTPFVDLVCCHEVDPTQAGRVADQPWAVRTSPYPDINETFDVAFAAGFHHSHARIAIEALRRGKDAVVEKPLATTREDLGVLLAAAQNSSGRVFVAYQRRYSAFNRFLADDLRLTAGTPVSVAALVYEVPLPRHHWYRWPNSRGRIICNGCHWIDYFLFLNGFCPPKHAYARSSPSGGHVVQMTLENGAGFSMVITEEGSPLLNVRDVVRVAAGRRSALIVDQCRYEAEGPDRVLRRTRTRRANSIDRMYRTIARGLAEGANGDSLESLRVSGTAVLDIQDLVDESLGNRSGVV